MTDYEYMNRRYLVLRLVRVANEGDEAEIEKILLNKVDINSNDQEGNTALMEAVKKGYAKAVKTLVQNGADINMSDVYGVTPIVEAAGRGYVEIVKMLLSNGANVDVPYLQATLTFIEKKGYREITRILMDAQYGKWLSGFWIWYQKLKLLSRVFMKTHVRKIDLVKNYEHLKRYSDSIEYNHATHERFHTRRATHYEISAAYDFLNNLKKKWRWAF